MKRCSTLLMSVFIFSASILLPSIVMADSSMQHKNLLMYSPECDSYGAEHDLLIKGLEQYAREYNAILLKYLIK